MLVDEIKTRVNIVELAKQLGCEVTSSGYMKSIYRDEKNPSLKIYNDTNSYYCFSTGQGGDVITFYADYFCIDMKQAINEMAEKYSISYKSKLKNTICLKVNEVVLMNEQGYLNMMLDYVEMKLS